jgi:hypothetical protein
VSQAVNGCSKLLQGFFNELGPSFQLSVEHSFQVVVTVAILKLLINAAGLFKVVIRCVIFSWAVQQFYSTTVSNCHQNTAHHIDMVHLGSCIEPMLVSVLPENPRSAQASTSLKLVSSPCCVVSTRVIVVSISTCVPWILRFSFTRKSYFVFTISLWSSFFVSAISLPRSFFVSIISLWMLQFRVLRNICNLSRISSIIKFSSSQRPHVH